MGTDRPRIQAYIEPELYEQFQRWKQNAAIEKDSAALNALLADYFREQLEPVSQTVSVSRDEIESIIDARVQAEVSRQFSSLKHLEATIDPRVVNSEVDRAIMARIEENSEFWVNRLSERLVKVEQSLERFINSSAAQYKEIQTDLGERLVAVEDSLEVLLSESPGEAKEPNSPRRSPHPLPETPAPGVEEVKESNLYPERITVKTLVNDSVAALNENGDLPSEPLKAESSELSGESSSELPGESSAQSIGPLHQAALARRLGCHRVTLNKKQDKPNFAQWTRERDPDAIAWKYDRESKVFVPL